MTITTITAPGIYKDFNEDAYHADPCPMPSLNQSIAKVLIEQTAKHARAEHPRLKVQSEEPETEKYVKAQAIGNAAHAIMIGRGKTILGCSFDNWTTKDAKKFKADAIAEGKVPILDHDLETAHRMVLAARLQLTNIGAVDAAVDKFFREGDGEVVVAAEIDGVWFRSLVDWMVNPGLLVDYKTTGLSVAPHAVPKLMADAGWPIQAAMQDMILNAITPPETDDARRFFFVAQEHYEPFELTVHELPRSTMQMGHKMLSKAEGMWRTAIKSNVWTGYAPVIHRPEYPGWKEAAWLNREIADASAERVPLPSGKMDPTVLMAG